MFRQQRRGQSVRGMVVLAFAGVLTALAAPATPASAAGTTGCVQTATIVSIPADVFLAGGNKYYSVTCTVINSPAFSTITKDPNGTPVPVPLGAENSAYAGAKYTQKASGTLPNGQHVAACAIRLGANAQNQIYALVRDNKNTWGWVVSVTGIQGTSGSTGATEGLKDCTDPTIIVGNPAFKKPDIPLTSASNGAATPAPATAPAGDISISGDPTSAAPAPDASMPAVATPTMPAPAAADPTALPAADTSPAPAPAPVEPPAPATSQSPGGASGPVASQISELQKLITDLVTKLMSALKSLLGK